MALLPLVVQDESLCFLSSYYCEKQTVNGAVHHITFDSYDTPTELVLMPKRDPLPDAETNFIHSELVIMYGKKMAFNAQYLDKPVH